MKNLKSLFSVFAVCGLLIFAGQSCKKASADENGAQIEAADNLDNSTISEEDFEMQEDPLPYEPEAVTVTVTGGTKPTDSDADGGGSTIKAAFAKAIGINATTVTLNLAFDKNVNIQSIKNENTKTGTGDITGSNAVGQRITFSDVTMGSDSMHWTVKIAASDTFRLGSAKMQIKYTELNTKLVPTAKVKNVTVYCIGKNSSGKYFGSQAWGYAYEGGNSARYTGTPVAIDSNFVPAVGDLLTTSSGAQRAIITGVTEGAAPTTTSQIAKGLKYTCNYVIWNAKGTGARKAAKASWYRKQAPTAKADGTNILSHKVH